MNKNIHIPVVLGSARVGRESEKVANYLVSVLSKREDVTTELIDVKDCVKVAVTTPAWGEGGADSEGSKWKDVIDNTNALILVIPEYNHGYPGELKLLLDSLGSHYKGLPVAIAGVSSGALGGARVADHIKPILVELYMSPIRESILFARVKDSFNDDGSIKDEKTTEFVNRIVEELSEAAQKINI